MSSPSPAGVTALGFDEAVPVGRLRPAPYNPRKIDDEEFERLKASLREHGFVDPIVARQSDGLVVGGHMRLRAYQALGRDAVPVRWIECDDRAAKALNVALNNPRLAGQYDEAALGALLEELRAEGADPLTGFDGGEVDRIIEDAKGRRSGLTDPDAIPAPPPEASTKRGDLYVLGDHRLLCGDASSVEDLDRVLAGDPVRLVNTDPPYNAHHESSSSNARAAGSKGGGRPRTKGKADAVLRPRDRRIENDAMTWKEFEKLLRAWFRNVARVMEPGASFYVWGGYKNAARFPAALEASGLYYSQAIIWVKRHPGMSRADFMRNHEWAFYGWKEGAGHYFDGRIRNVPDVWEGIGDPCNLEWSEARAHDAIPSEAQDVWPVKKVSPARMIHLTEKPVELAARALKFSSRPHDVVLDAFSGAGSTIIAAEQLGRRARALELDPLYCDVIVRRWEQFTGRAAVLERRSS